MKQTIWIKYKLSKHTEGKLDTYLVMGFKQQGLLAYKLLAS